MRKKVILMQIAIAFACSQAIAVLAANSDTGPGCGLGKVAWTDYKRQKTIVPQLLMSTTNNTILPWQAFGITTGTLGCTNDGVWLAEHKMNGFAAINFENLTQEMAQGHGEHLMSLATLMGIPAERQAEFCAMTQEKYASLVKSGETTPVAMLKALNDAMIAHPVLANISMNR